MERDKYSTEGAFLLLLLLLLFPLCFADITFSSSLVLLLSFLLPLLVWLACCSERRGGGCALLLASLPRDDSGMRKYLHGWERRKRRGGGEPRKRERRRARKSSSSFPFPLSFFSRDREIPFLPLLSLQRLVGRRRRSLEGEMEREGRAEAPRENLIPARKARTLPFFANRDATTLGIPLSFLPHFIRAPSLPLPFLRTGWWCEKALLLSVNSIQCWEEEEEGFFSHSLFALSNAIFYCIFFSSSSSASGFLFSREFSASLEKRENVEEGKRRTVQKMTKALTWRFSFRPLDTLDVASAQFPAPELLVLYSHNLKCPEMNFFEGSEERGGGG